MKIGNRTRTGALGMCVSPEKQASPLRIAVVLVACARSVMLRRHAVATRGDPHQAWEAWSNCERAPADLEPWPELVAAALVSTGEC